MWLEDNLVTQKILNPGLAPQPAGPQLTPPNEGLLPGGAPTVIMPEPKGPPALNGPSGVGPGGNPTPPRIDGGKPGGAPPPKPPGGAGAKKP
jgi:hypothetical protein